MVDIEVDVLVGAQGEQIRDGDRHVRPEAGVRVRVTRSDDRKGRRENDQRESVSPHTAKVRS